MKILFDQGTSLEDALKQQFLNALNDGGGVAEAAAYLDSGGDIDAPIVPVIDHTLLHYAAINLRLDLIEMLARRGADLDARNSFGMTAMHMAVTHEIDAVLLRRQEPDLLCARKLLDLGASVGVTDKQGMTPRDVAKAYGPLMLDLFDEVMNAP